MFFPAGRRQRSNRMRGVRRGATSLCVLLGLLVVAPAASARTQLAHRGGVTATFSFSGRFPNYHSERLTITRAGMLVYQQPVTSGFCTPCAPGSALTRRSSVHVVDLEHTGQPDVVLDLYTGGAHCCTVEQIFSFDPISANYVKTTERDFGDPLVRIVDLGHNGHFQLLTADDRFAYAFTDFAASGLPIQIFQFSGGRFIDVTRHYRGQVARDAARWLRAFNSLAHSGYDDSVGVIAAWAADEDLLGHVTRVRRYLARQAAAGHLNAPFDAGGDKFVTKLKRFLRALGYVR
jgi:hypothetical protein